MPTFDGEYKKLNAAQKQAVDTIEGPVLVIAGPGTGKTQLLSMRVANILDKTDMLPQNILCLTFTESAVTTLRQRLSNLIGQAAYDVTISTYHAFGSELIRRYPDYFVDDPDSRPADDLTIDRIFRQILADLPYSNPLKFSGRYVRDIVSLISDFKRTLLTPDEVRTIASANLAYIERTSVVTRSLLATLKRVDKASMSLFAELADKTRAAATLPSPLPDHIRYLQTLWQEELEAALEFYGETGKTTAVTAWKTRWLEKDDVGGFIVGKRLASRKLQAAADLYEAYQDALVREHLYDYDDMILKAIRGLETNADLRFTLQEQYQYLLLDEFQDTNAAQLRLVELLADNPVHEGRPNIMAVGDDDQAIYAFQGADYSHMLSFARSYRDVLVVPLTENYRSHADILHLAHGIAEQIETRLQQHFEGVNKVLMPANKHLPAKAVVERHEFKSDLAQFSWVAKQIDTLIKNGTPAEEIAVLAPQHRYLEPLVGYLNQLHIPLRYEKRENVLDDPVITELITMSQLVLALGRGDEELTSSLWPEVLSYPCWRLPTSLIWQLSWQAHQAKTDWTSVLLEHAETKHLALFFIRLSLIAGAETLESMMDYLIGVTPLDLQEPDLDKFRAPFYECYFGAPSQNADPAVFWNLLSNLTVLRQHLREYRANETVPLHLEDFVEFVRAHDEAQIKILNTSPYHEASEAVQLMTAFKAKGQEFDVVFVLATLDEVWGGKARGQSSRVPLPANMEQIRYGGATDDERLRLFFVASTRAKTQLYLTSFSSNYSGRPTTRLRYLNEIEEDDRLISQLLPPGRQVVRRNDTSAPTVNELANYWHTRHIEAGKKVNLQALLAPRLERFQLSPTHLNSFVDTIYGGPEHFFLNTILRFPKAPTPSGQYGNAIHETLEWIHLFNRRRHVLPSTRQALRYFDEHLAAKRLSQVQTAQLQERGHLAITTYLAERGSDFKATNEHEFDFRHEGVFVGEAHLTGKIDQLIIDKAAKTITVVDFKTGPSYTRWLRDAKLHKYQQQLYFYKLLVEKSHTFAGYKVTDAYLQFVEPTDGRGITDLHLKFEATEMERMKHLIEKVWEHTHKLSFPSVTSFSQDLVGILAFEETLLAEEI